MADIWSSQLLSFFRKLFALYTNGLLVEQEEGWFF
jgi:hypothetical protein